ncbi:hypothetical protein NL676_030201 [Syzygium grande]|nr:hypothetical protein NL676_030201 [Syzygium grande]
MGRFAGDVEITMATRRRVVSGGRAVRTEKLAGTSPAHRIALRRLISDRNLWRGNTCSSYEELGSESLGGINLIANRQSVSLDANAFSGELPDEIGDLTGLLELLASDNNLNGSIPDFIGNWLKLTELRLQGNSFAGPIPLNFSKLISLKELRVSEISGGFSTLEFLKDMGNLTTLDLSFNYLHGSIPDSIFTLGSLSYLSLGSNNLSGALPSKKGISLVYIDVSYNNLSGNFPSWVKENIQTNFVANYFTAESSNSG